jgi:hypothetical protein
MSEWVGQCICGSGHFVSHRRREWIPAFTCSSCYRNHPDWENFDRASVLREMENESRQIRICQEKLSKFNNKRSHT